VILRNKGKLFYLTIEQIEHFMIMFKLILIVRTQAIVGHKTAKSFEKCIVVICNGSGRLQKALEAH
jgi:hypothetical protein